MPTCASCGGTTSSVWYGRAGEDHFCKKRACQRYGGFDAPLRGGPPASRQRRTTNSTGAASSDEDAFTPLTTSAEVVAEVYSCLGQRCVLPACLPAFALLCSASPSTAPYCAVLHRFCNVAALSAGDHHPTALKEEDKTLNKFCAFPRLAHFKARGTARPPFARVAILCMLCKPIRQILWT